MTQTVGFDGYRLDVEQSSEGAWAVNFIGTNAAPLNNLLAEVIGDGGPNRDTESNWRRIKDGIGKSSEAFAYEPYESTAIELDYPEFHLMKASWEAINRRRLKGLIWWCKVSWQKEACYIPHATLMSVMSFARSLALENDQRVLKKIIEVKAPLESLSKGNPEIDFEDRGGLLPTPVAKQGTPFSAQLIPLSALNRMASEYLVYARFEQGSMLDVVRAGRRDLLQYLGLMGLYPGGLSKGHLEEAQKGGFKAIETVFDSMLKLQVYSDSDERKRWNPDQVDDGGIESLPIVIDWFANSDMDENWDPMDILSRCERIWKDEHDGKPGFVITRLLGKRIKLFGGHEWGKNGVCLQRMAWYELPDANQV